MARQIIENDDTIPCTACCYCVEGCPQQINIPEIFAAMNANDAEAYKKVTAEGGKASDCIGCGQCENACPQQLPIIENLKKAAAKFE